MGDVHPRPFVPKEVVNVGRHQFLLNEAIGEGAYACVWSATPMGVPWNEEVAIKEMRCGQGPGILPDATVQRARFEIQVMQKLTDAEGEEVCAPRLIDHQFWQLGPTTPGAFLCRVAMTRRRGVSLISWLEERVARFWQSPSRSPRSSSSDSQSRLNTYCTSYLHATRAARAMLVQLSPTFRRLNDGIAFHRDVNARNLLVFLPDTADEEVAPGAAPTNDSLLEFSLVDFGSSTDARAWLGVGQGSWAAENPTGDARYWGPASWARFLGGADCLSRDPALVRQYSRRLDVFALAACSLEVIAKLHTAECPQEVAAAVNSKGGTPQSQSKQAALAQGMLRAQSTWSAYWSVAVSSFERLAEYSRLVCCGDQQGASQSWQDLVRGGIPKLLQGKLHAHCDDLVSLAELCRHYSRSFDGSDSVSQQAWVQAADTLQALRDMLHESSTMEWQELHTLLTGVSLRPTCPSKENVHSPDAAAAAAAAAAASKGLDNAGAKAGNISSKAAADIRIASPRLHRQVKKTDSRTAQQLRLVSWLDAQAPNPQEGYAMERCNLERHIDEGDADTLQILQQVDAEVRTLRLIIHRHLCGQGNHQSNGEFAHL